MWELLTSVHHIQLILNTDKKNYNTYNFLLDIDILYNYKDIGKEKHLI